MLRFSRSAIAAATTVLLAGAAVLGSTASATAATTSATVRTASAATVFAGGPYLQTLRPALQEGEQVLLFEQSMLAGNQLVPDTGRPAVLLEGIADVAFSYRGIDESGELSDWQERWPSTTSLPLLVRIEVRFEDPRTRWPVLEVELARAGSGSGARLVPRTTAPRPSVVRPGTRQ